MALEGMSGWGAHRELLEAKAELKAAVEARGEAETRLTHARERHANLLVEMSKKLCAEEPDLAQAVANQVRQGGGSA